MDAHSSSSTFDDLFRQAHAGDRDALGKLFLRWQAHLHRVAARRLGNCRAAPSSMVQECFIVVKAKIFQCRATSQWQFKNWLCSILLSICDKELRRKRNQDINLGNQANSSNPNPGPADTGPSPPEIVAKAEQIARLSTMLDKLPPDDRELLRLLYEEEKTYEDILAILELDVNKTNLERIRKRAQRAREKLRRHLDQPNEE